MRIRRCPDPGPFTSPSDYKPHLRAPFQSRCAYCRTPDLRTGGLEGMTVDHFRPVSRYVHLRLAWTNLYYACSVCNSHYKRERPTAAEEAAGERFVDPCRMDPDNHFRLGPDSTGGRLVVTSSTRPGRYTIRVLGFNERCHLRDWWMELDRQEVEVEQQLASIRDCIQQARATRRRSEAARALELLERLRQLEAESLSQLHRIHSQWPFPVRRRAED